MTKSIFLGYYMEINKLFLYQLTYTRNISMKNIDAFYKAQIQIKHCSFHNKQKINCNGM